MFFGRDRQIRRFIGAVVVGINGMHLRDVDDPRNPKKIRHKLANLLALVLVGMLAGRKNAKGLELLTEQMPLYLLRQLGFDGRVADTSVRDVLARLTPDALRPRLHAQIRTAHRRKQLVPAGLPFHVVSIDGKYTVTTHADDRWAQGCGGGLFRVGTLTAALVSTTAPVCLDAFPIPKENNEMTAFRPAFLELVGAYGSLDLFRVVTVDAGMASLENANLVVENGRDYLFALKDTQPTLLDEVDRLLSRRHEGRPAATSLDVINNGKTETRRLWITKEIAGYHWDHVKTGLCVEREVVIGGVTTSKECRFYVSSLPLEALTKAQWLGLVRRHWRVENEAHGVYDRFFNEDEHPWFRVPSLMLVGFILRRLAANMLILYRNVTTRGEYKGLTPWANLVSWIETALVAALPCHLEGLRWPDFLTRPTNAPPGNPA